MCFDLIWEVIGRYFIPNWKGGNRQLEHMAGLGRGVATAKFIHLLGEQGTAGKPLAPWRACFVVEIISRPRVEDMKL